MAGNIKKMANGKFRVALDFGKDASTGQRIRKYQTVSSEADAKKILSEHEYNQQRNLTVQPSSMTLAEFLQIWFDNYVKYNCEETTMYGYKNIINNHIVPMIGNLDLQKVQPISIQNYYKHLLEEKKLSANTVHKHHAVLRKAFDFGLKQQFIYRNVADAVSLPKVSKFVGQAYTKEQLKNLLNMVSGNKIELPVYLAGYMGLRREEIVGLKWKYIDFNQRLLSIKEVRTSAGSNIIVKAPKTEKSQRTLAIPDKVFEILITWKGKQEGFKQLLKDEYEDSGYVYVHDNGKPYRVNSITEQFKTFLEKNNLPVIRFHDLRHTFVSILYEEGLDLKSISEAVGHSDTATTDKIYTHRLDVIHKKTMNVISEALE